MRLSPCPPYPVPSVGEPSANANDRAILVLGPVERPTPLCVSGPALHQFGLLARTNGQDTPTHRILLDSHSRPWRLSLRPSTIERLGAETTHPIPAEGRELHPACPPPASCPQCQVPLEFVGFLFRIHLHLTPPIQRKTQNAARAGLRIQVLNSAMQRPYHGNHSRPESAPTMHRASPEHRDRGLVASPLWHH